MITLCMDTCNKFLTLALIEDNKLIGSYNEPCFKRQSESIIVELKKLFNKCNLTPDDVNQICITDGPGSYTGIRIAMTIAKVFASMKNLKLFTVSSLRLYANGKENTMVIMDARSKRVYLGVYNHNEVVVEDCVLPISDVDFKDYNLIGDLSIIGKEDVYYNNAEAFLNTIDYWKEVENVDLVVPRYLKDTKDYLQNV